MSFDYINPTIIRMVERKWWNDRVLEETILKEHHLTYALSGKATYIIDGETYEVTKGDVIYIKAGSKRKAIANNIDPIHIYNIMFSIKNTKGIESLPIKGIVKAGFDNVFFDYYKELNNLWLSKKDGYTLQSRGLLILILHKLIYQRGYLESRYKKNNLIESIKDYLTVNYYKNIDIKSLAKRFNMHYAYIGTYFKKYTGMTIKEYITKIRISRAKDLLSSMEYTVSEVAFECGYTDVYYFSNVFKRETGIRPTDFKKINYFKFA